jgi:hypothetical protein
MNENTPEGFHSHSPGLPALPGYPGFDRNIAPTLKTAMQKLEHGTIYVRRTARPKGGFFQVIRKQEEASRAISFVK